jgi:NAD(P)H dehydrogenase (quinone)
MIVVTGATGHLGRLIVQKLVARLPASQIAVSVRDSQKAADLEALGVRVRQGDFAKPESLKHAFEGARQLLMVSSNARASGGDSLAQHRSAIDTARALGVHRIVYTSHQAASATSAFPPMHDHAATEDLLRASGLQWTALRNGFYADSGLALMGNALETGELEAPPDGKVSWTAHDDLAEAAAIIVNDVGRADGPTPPLTAGQSLDLTELAALASALLGRTVRRALITEEALRARMLARGVPERNVLTALGLYAASHRGEFDVVDPTLERLLGRAPIRLDALLAKKIADAKR